MRRILMGALAAAILTAGPAMAQGEAEAEAEAEVRPVDCIIAGLSDADYVAVGQGMIDSSEDAPAGFDEAAQSCSDQYGWTEDQVAMAAENAIYSAGFDVAMATLEADGVTAEQVDTLMQSLPRKVALSMGSEEHEFTDENAEFLLGKMEDAGIAYSDETLGLLTTIVVAALGIQEVEADFPD